MKSKAPLRVRKTRTVTPKSISLLEQSLLSAAQTLCDALYQVNSTDKQKSFQLWKTYWIASNGEIGRKKQITNDLFNGAIGDESDADPYHYLFTVETALVHIAKHLAKASLNTPIRENAASAIFEWWAENPSSNVLTAAAQVGQIFADVRKSELLRELSEDPLRRIYHALIPKAIRHTLGAYLSPPDLCIHVLHGVSIQELFDNPKIRLIEPNCGLGAFFCALLSVAPNASANQDARSAVGFAFLNQIYGVEKNLGSYVVSRYLHAAICGLLTDKLPEDEHITWADSVFVDETFITEQLSSSLSLADRVLLAGPLRIQCRVPPSGELDVMNHGSVIAFFDGGEWRSAQSPLRSWLQTNTEARGLHELAVAEAVRLETLRDFDLIVGNPPWVNWENLDPDYKALILPSWPPLGLFAMSGRDRAFSKEDLSVLATYSACLRFGKLKTRVGLLLPQALFQSRKNSKGFRRFRIGQSGIYLQVQQITDFSDYAAFGDAKNRTAAFFCTLSTKPTEYPVRYMRFVPGTNDAGAADQYVTQQAAPSDQFDPTSNWAIFGETEEIKKQSKRERNYRARTGVFTGGANAVYYIRIDGQDGNLVWLRNETERAKIKVAEQRFLAEMDYVYPFAKGRDVKQWHIERPAEQGILLPHSPETRIRPVSPDTLAAQAPRTLTYLSQYREMLQTRASLTALDRANVQEGFYALLRVGEYTFAPHKVAWKYISKEFCCAVIGPEAIGGAVKPTILQEKLISIAFDRADEAFFVCAFLSAPQIKREIERRIVGTQVSVHVIEDIHIPSYDPDNVRHKQMAAICRDGHKSDGLTLARSELLAKLVAEIDAIDTKSLARPASTSASPSEGIEFQSTIETS